MVCDGDYDAIVLGIYRHISIYHEIDGRLRSGKIYHPDQD